MAQKKTVVSSDYELWAALDASGFAVYRLRELELAPFHLTVEQAAVLRVLESAGRGVTAKELRDLTLRQQNTISILVARMAAGGLTASEREAGKRESKILVTPRGTSLLEEVPTVCLKQVFSALGGEEKRNLAGQLRCLNDRARSLLTSEESSFLHHLARRETQSSAREKKTNSPPSDYGLWSQLDSTRFAISRLRELELAQHGLTVEQASLIRVLGDAGSPVTIRNLEDSTLRQHNSVLALIGRVTKMGLASREIDVGDRRYRFFLTEKGRNLLAGLPSVALEMTFSALGEPEKQGLGAYLMSLYQQARGMLGYGD